MQKENGLLQSAATAHNYGCRGGQWPPAGDESSPLQMLWIDFGMIPKYQDDARRQAL